MQGAICGRQGLGMRREVDWKLLSLEKKKKLYLFHFIHSTFLVALQFFYHEKLETDGMELKITMGP